MHQKGGFSSGFSLSKDLYAKTYHPFNDKCFIGKKHDVHWLAHNICTFEQNLARTIGNVARLKDIKVDKNTIILFQENIPGVTLKDIFAHRLDF